MQRSSLELIKVTPCPGFDTDTNKEPLEIAASEVLAEAVELEHW